MITSILGTGTRPNVLRELAYTLLLSGVALVSMFWVGLDRNGALEEPVAFVLPQ